MYAVMDVGCRHCNRPDRMLPPVFREAIEAMDWRWDQQRDSQDAEACTLFLIVKVESVEE